MSLAKSLTGQSFARWRFRGTCDAPLVLKRLAKNGNPCGSSNNVILLTRQKIVELCRFLFPFWVWLKSVLPL